ncbi:pseudouridine synthase [Flammeovirgaceae bacterium SG7u.111]|nr:pseudouridine synthase [Flammeovirgaceae bacterium SG7u.132]WPO37545.1 pseudouridine synthase [Flammeovirgaceae bacterium SG7u.111]
MKLEILYQDDRIVAINKPAGLMVHRSSMDTLETVFVLQLLRDQLGQHVFPVHRLDRKTSGVLMFALDSETTRLLQAELEKEETTKKYIAIVRGYFPQEMHLDYALSNDRGNVQDAVTDFELVKTTELPVPFGKHQTSRYSLIEAYPKTGRTHQIRKHCSHLRHPIIGDRKHGCNKQNKLFTEKWRLDGMMLHAESLSIVHPYSGKEMLFTAGENEEFKRMKSELSLG